MSNYTPEQNRAIAKQMPQASRQLSHEESVHWALMQVGLSDSDFPATLANLRHAGAVIQDHRTGRVHISTILILDFYAGWL